MISDISIGRWDFEIKDKYNWYNMAADSQIKKTEEINTDGFEVKTSKETGRNSFSGAAVWQKEGYCTILKSQKGEIIVFLVVARLGVVPRLGG
jgi:hypothetical protein